MPTNFDPTDKESESRQQAVYTLWKQNTKVPNIVTALVETYPNITAAQVIEDIRSCRANIKKFADDHPFYLDGRLRLILERVESLEVIKGELWTQYHGEQVEEIEGVVVVVPQSIKIKLLDLIQKNEMEQAKILQLLGNASEVVTKLEQASKAQQELIQAVRDVTSTCPQCANALALKLKHMGTKKKEESAPKDTMLN